MKKYSLLFLSYLTTSLPLFFLFTCLLCFAKEVNAATTFNDADGADSEVDNAGNWDFGVPDNVGNAGTVPTGFNVTYDAALDLNGKDITFEGTSTLTGPNSQIDDATLTFKGSSSYTSTGAIAPARNDNGVTTTINILDSAVLSIASQFKVARAGIGIVNQSGGTVTAVTDFELGNLAKGGTATYTLSAGTISANGFSIENGSVLNFTVGSTGVLSILNGGLDFTSNFEDFINNGGITLGGAAALVSDFDINWDGTTKTTIGLVGGVPQPLGLVVNTTTGLVTLNNPNAAPIAIDYYEIRSSSGDLIPGFDADFQPDGDVDSTDLSTWQSAYGATADGDADNDGDSDGRDFLIWQREVGSSAVTSGWVSLEDQHFDGNGWEEGDTVSDTLLFETHLTGSSNITSSAPVGLGKLFTPGGSEILSFEYHVAGAGSNDFVTGDVSYVTSLSAVGAVPEPNSFVLLATCSLAYAAVARSRRRADVLQYEGLDCKSQSQLQHP